MIDQVFDNFRKASESSLQAQQDFFKSWAQQWSSTPLAAPALSGDWSEAQKRWLEATSEALNKHRSLLDATYKSGIEIIEHTFRFTEARSPEDYRRLVEELWRKLTDTFKAQSETQYREINNFYTATVYEKGAEIVRMLKTLIGERDFRRGMDLYFERCDGTAATVEDFLQAFAEIRELHDMAAHFASIVAFNAAATRAWPGKYSHSKACG